LDAFIHDPDHYTHGADQPAMFATAMSGARKALLRLKEQGVVRAIGMGVNDTDVCMAGADAGGFDVFLLAGKYTLLHQDSLNDLMPRALKEGFSIIIGRVFNSGILATGVTPTAYDDNEPPTAEIADRVNRFEAAATKYGISLARSRFISRSPIPP
jgi:D-threo-aldose 1-dehydrogenase